MSNPLEANCEILIATTIGEAWSDWFDDFEVTAADELEVGLTDALRIESQAAADAHEFLRQGPVTSQKVSRLTATQTSVIIESEA